MKAITHFCHAPEVQQIAKRYGSDLFKLSLPDRFELIGFLGLWVAECFGDGPDDCGWQDCPFEAEPEPDVKAILEICYELETHQVARLIEGIAQTIQ
jgi:hypothetical protein